MTSMAKIRVQAVSLGIERCEEMDRIHLIRNIQRCEGHKQCYCDQYCDGCIRQGCLWRYDCSATVIACNQAIHLDKAA